MTRDVIVVRHNRSTGLSGGSSSPTRHIHRVHTAPSTPSTRSPWLTCSGVAAVMFNSPPLGTQSFPSRNSSEVSFSFPLSNTPVLRSAGTNSNDCRTPPTRHFTPDLPVGSHLCVWGPSVCECIQYAIVRPIRIATAGHTCSGTTASVRPPTALPAADVVTLGVIGSAPGYRQTVAATS